MEQRTLHLSVRSLFEIRSKSVRNPFEIRSSLFKCCSYAVQMISLSAWCKEHSLSKSTVHGKARELGIDTSQGLSAEAVQQLENYYQVNKVVDPSTPSINSGNHRTDAVLPAINPNVDLGHLRTGADLTCVNGQTLAQVDDALLLIDGVLDAIETDTNFQVSQLQATTQKTNQLRRKVDQLQQRKAQYETESKLLGLLQNQKTQELGQSMADVSELLNSGD